jgi:tetratricopeptide (TPR) repeat protein
LQNNDLAADAALRGARADEARAGLEAALDRARAQDDSGAVLDALVRLASVEVAFERPGLALPLLAEARGLVAAGVGTPLQAAQVAFVRGQALAHSGGDPLASLREAVVGFLAVDRPADAHRARQRIVQALEARGRLPEAIAELGALIAGLAPEDPERVDAHRLRATLHTSRADFDAARLDYDAAVEAAERLGDTALHVRMRLERRGVVPVRTPDRWEDWRCLLRDAHRLRTDRGLVGEAGEVHLEQAALALAGERLDQGVAFAAAARQAALRAREPVLFLMACLLIAEGREGQGDHTGVLEALIGCRATLGRTFGPDYTHAVTTILDALEPRWGKPLFDRALEQYRAHHPTRRVIEGLA